jgi:hypothetical protein
MDNCDVVVEIDMTIVKVVMRKDNFPIFSMVYIVVTTNVVCYVVVYLCAT